MKRWVVQFICGKRPADVDECDLDWREIKGESFVGEGAELRAWETAEMYDRDFDHRFTHRAALVEVEAPPVPRPVAKAKAAPPAPVAPAPVAKAPVKAKPAPRLEGSPLPVQVNRQLSEFRAQTRFTANADRLRRGLAAGVDFEFLLPFVELLEADLPHCGRSLLAKRFAEQLAAMRALVEGNGSAALRVIK